MFCLLCCATALPALGADRTWTGATDNDWNTATNWSGNAVPGAADNAFINLPDGPVVNGIIPDAVNQLRIGNSGNGMLTVENGAAANSMTTVYVGTLDGSHGNLNIQSGGIVASEWVMAIAHNAGASGAATVTGTNSLLDSGGELRIGNGGTGILTVQDGGTAQSFSHTQIGTQTNSAGAVIVTGADSLLDSGEELRIGSFGTGILAVRDGGTVQSFSHIQIGTQTDSVGTVTVTGADSLLDSGSILYVGNSGAGTLTVQDGGVAQSFSHTYIGNNVGGTGTVTVAGIDSRLDGEGALHVGRFGTGTLTVMDGGSANTDTVLFVGSNSGSNGTLTIESGGKVKSTGIAVVGSTANSTGNAAVSGIDSVLESGHHLFVGENGTGMLTVAQEATVRAGSGSLRIASNGGSNGTLNIGAADGDAPIAAGIVDAADILFGNGTGRIVFNHTDAAYTFAPAISGTGVIDVLSGTTTLTGDNSGFTGSINVKSGTLEAASTLGGVMTGATTITNGTFNVLNGAVVNNAAGTVGNSAGSNGFANVSGANSEWISNGQLRVSDSGTGTLTIRDGGAVTSTGFSYLGFGASATGTVTVEGTGSSLTSQDQLRVGQSGAGSLTIRDGGTVTAGRTYIGTLASSHGTVTVEGAGSILASQDEMRVGGNGTGMMTVQNGGKATSAEDFYIAVSDNAEGVVIVDGAGSEISSTNRRILVGVNDDTTGTLIVRNGGKAISAQATYISWTNNSNGTAIIDGAGSELRGTQLGIGSNGSSTGLLRVQNGGKVGSTTNHIQIGLATNSNGTAIVTGAGSELNSNSQLQVGVNGTGTLAIQDGSRAASNGIAYIGTNANSTGTVLVDGAGSALSSGSTLRVGNSGTGTLTVSRGGLAQSTGILHIAFNNNSTGTLNIGAAEGDAPAAAGIIDAPSIAFGAGTGRIVFNHTNTDYQFATDMTGNGTLDFLSGATVLTGDGSLFTGTAAVNGGTLRVNGILSAVGTTVENGGRFGGTGTIGDLIVDNGGTLAPGNSIGTVNVANAVFNPGAVYEVELNAAGQSDLLNASGTVTVNGGHARVIPHPDYALGTPYTIITAAGGVAGTFEGVLPAAFFTGQLHYVGNDVLLSLAPNASVAQTPNQQAVAGATYGVAGNAAINALHALPGMAAARQGLDALSGEIHAGLAAMQIGEQGLLRDTAFQRRPDRGAFWVHAFGTGGRTDSDGNAASTDTRRDGVLLGADRAFDGGHIGAAAGYSAGRLDIDGRASKARSENYHLMAYGGAALNDVGLTLDGGASWTWHEIETARAISFPGFSGSSAADYNAQTAQIFARLGQELAYDDIQLKPYAEAAYVARRAGSFREDGTAGLRGGAQTDHNGATTLGLDAARTWAFDNGQSLTLEGGLGWRHAVGGTDTGRTLSFRDAPDADFTIQGAPIARDALKLNLGAGFDMGDGVKLSVQYDATLARDAREQGLSFRARIGF